MLEPRQQSKRPLAPKTVENYRTIITRHLLPDWGDVPVEDFDARLVLSLFHTLRERHSDYVAHRAVSRLHSLLEVARRWRIIFENPVEFARPDIPPYETEERPALTPSETARLLRVVEGHPWEGIYYVALTLGLRLGELLGLQWDDIDWDAHTIIVRRQVQEVGRKICIRDSTKYGEGRRTLPLPPRLLARLYVLPRTSAYIFPNLSQQGHIRPGSFTYHFAGGQLQSRRGAEERRTIGVRTHAGLDSRVTVHSLRHTFATRMMELRVQKEIHDAIMGHGKVGIRERYTHVRIEVMREAIEAVEDALYEALSDADRTVRPAPKYGPGSRGVTGLPPWARTDTAWE